MTSQFDLTQISYGVIIPTSVYLTRFSNSWIPDLIKERCNESLKSLEVIFSV